MCSVSRDRELLPGEAWSSCYSPQLRWLHCELDQDQLLRPVGGVCSSSLLEEYLHYQLVELLVSEQAEHFPGPCSSVLLLPAVGGRRTRVRVSSGLSSQPEEPVQQTARCRASGRRLYLPISTFWAWITHSAFRGIEPKAEAQGSCRPMHHQGQQRSRRTYSL